VSFPTYPKYKDSGVEWLGQVPVHWPICLLKRAFRSVDYGISESLEPEGAIAILRMGNIENGKIVADDLRYVDSVDPALLLSRGDLLYNRTNSLDLIGKVGMYEGYSDLPMSFASYLVRLRTTDQSVPAYFVYLLNTEGILGVARASAFVAIGQCNLNPTRYGQINIAIPPKGEQAAIVAFLDEDTAKIDTLVAEQERLIELLKEKRETVISHAVTKGLNPHASMKPSGIEWLGDVPEHWRVKRLKHISPFVTVGIVVNPSTFLAEEGFPFIYGGDIREGVVDWMNARRIDAESSEANAKTRLNAGDLLTVRVGAPGVTAVVPAECEGGNCASVMLVRKGQFNSHWLCYAMNTRIVRFQVELVQYGAAQEQFNISHAVNFWMPTPPRTEQDEIISFLDRETAKLDALTTEAQSAIDLLQERRAALISAAVTGKIDVRGLAQTVTA
jgi:type I restriction enzyme S subunit